MVDAYGDVAGDFRLADVEIGSAHSTTRVAREIGNAKETKRRITPSRCGGTGSVPVRLMAEEHRPSGL